MDQLRRFRRLTAGLDWSRSQCRRILEYRMWIASPCLFGGETRSACFVKLEPKASDKETICIFDSDWPGLFLCTGRGTTNTAHRSSVTECGGRSRRNHHERLDGKKTSTLTGDPAWTGDGRFPGRSVQRQSTKGSQSSRGLCASKPRLSIPFEYVQPRQRGNRTPSREEEHRGGNAGFQSVDRQLRPMSPIIANFCAPIRSGTAGFCTCGPIGIASSNHQALARSQCECLVHAASTVPLRHISVAV